MGTSIKRICARCGQPFWWTVEEQEDCERRGVMHPRRCEKCRSVQTESPSPETAALAKRAGSSATTSFPELRQELIPDGIRQLMAEASAPIEYRSPTLVEWWNDEDVREKQMSGKISAGHAANTLLRQRIDCMALVSEITKRADEFRRERIAAQLADLELQDRIAEWQALRESRLAMQVALEARKHQKLLEPEPTPRPEREIVLEEHQLDRRARTRAGRELIEDFLREVQLVCDCKTSIHARALQLRNVLAAFEMDEDSLPADAHWILTTAEKLRDGA
jgi:hypothetical protein